VDLSSLDELPVVVFRLVQENQARKQKGEHSRAKLAQYQGEIRELQKQVETGEARILELEHETRVQRGQLKAHEKLDPHVYGAATLEELPAKFGALKQALRDSEARLTELTAKCQQQRTALLETKSSLFSATSSNQELKSVKQTLQNQVVYLEQENSSLGETVQHLSDELTTYSRHLVSVESKHSELADKAQVFDQVVRQLEQVLDFESPQAMAKVVLQLKKENDTHLLAIKTGQKQLNELFGSLTDLVLDRAITIPIASRTLRQIQDFFGTVNSTPDLRFASQFVLAQARENGWSGNQTMEAIAVVEQILNRARETRNECARLQEQLKGARSEAKDHRRALRLEAETELNSIRGQLDAAQKRVDTLTEVKSNLVHLHAQEKYNAALLKKELSPVEQGKVGLRRA
jgi:chromosome segregation ATPase